MTNVNQNRITSSQYIKDTSREYSLYVCENRAIPKVTDGLKDVQRKIIWLMRNSSDKIKTVSLAGQCISSNLYLHGDASAAGAISMLAAPFVNNVPLLQGIGAFGTRTAPVDGIGAPRYTYVKRSQVLQNLMLTDLDIVPLKDNYDGSVKEPVHFLPLIPTVLLNGVSGIAVGWSTEILRRKFSDIVQASIDALDGKKIKTLVPHYERYDVGVIHLEGNTWEISGKIEKLDSSTFLVTELPPDLSLSKFKDRLNTLEDEGKINTYVDSSTKTIDIKIKMPRGSIANWSTEKAIDYFKLRQKKSERIVVVDWNNSSIKQYETAEEVVEKFVAWRLNWFSTRYEYMKAEDEYSLNYLYAIRECFKAKLPSKLSGYQNRGELETAVKDITKHIELDKSQLDRLVSSPTYRWTADVNVNNDKLIADHEARIANYVTILADPKKLKKIYRDELVELSKLKLV